MYTSKSRMRVLSRVSPRKVRPSCFLTRPSRNGLRSDTDLNNHRHKFKHTPCTFSAHQILDCYRLPGLLAVVSVMHEFDRNLSMILLEAHELYTHFDVYIEFGQVIAQNGLIVSLANKTRIALQNLVSKVTSTQLSII